MHDDIDLKAQRNLQIEINYMVKKHQHGQF